MFQFCRLCWIIGFIFIVVQFHQVISISLGWIHLVQPGFSGFLHLNGIGYFYAYLFGSTFIWPIFTNFGPLIFKRTLLVCIWVFRLNSVKKEGNQTKRQWANWNQINTQKKQSSKWNIESKAFQRRFRSFCKPTRLLRAALNEIALRETSWPTPITDSVLTKLDSLWGQRMKRTPTIGQWPARMSERGRR